MKKFPVLLLAIFLLISSSCSRTGNNRYVSEWKQSPDGVWIGPELWANRLQDWKVQDGKLLCVSTKPMRTAHLTTRRAIERKGNINSSVYVSMDNEGGYSGIPSAGFLIGAGRDLDYRAASLIHHSYGEQAGLYIGLDVSGNLFIRDFEKEDEYLQYNDSNNEIWDEVYLILSVKPQSDDHYLIKVSAIDPVTNLVIDKLETGNISAERTEGNIALVAHSGSGNSKNTYFAFSNWQVSGSKLNYEPQHTMGPIMGLQYMLSRSSLKIKVQMMPLAAKDEHSLSLDIKVDDNWKNISGATIDTVSCTALFDIEEWDYKNDIPFRVNYNLKRKANHKYTETGTIKHDPHDRDSITVLSLSCIEQIIKPDRNRWLGIDAGYFPWTTNMLYPHNQLIENLKQFDADLLFFAGDQVYEGASPTAADTGPNARLDYLYKWYLWCTTYNELTAIIPSVSIPDDHDVYHGNLWGAGGRATPEGLRGAAAQDEGGYKMSPSFVNMVQTTQTSHLPDPYDPEPVEQGIGVYYTECNIGGVSFAIIEDRKFKSPPKKFLPEADIFNGWPRNKNWNARRSSGTSATLLGKRQLDFLEDWAGDWSGASWMKAVLSQTLFTNLATIPDTAMNDNVIQAAPVPDSGIVITTDKFANDFDSNGWPQQGRNNALKIFRKAFATHIAGDQHLGSTVQYGIDSYNDAGYAIVSPATGCIWSRRWHPPVSGRNRKEDWPSNLGEFEDGLGNKITVHAVANPHKSKVEPTRHNELSTGYSSIVFDKNNRTIELANWPYYAGPENGNPFPFWPVRFKQIDNYGRKATAWLPELQVEGMKNPVVKIYRERTGELVYSLRLPGNTFQPKVFFFGNYTIEIGDPDTDRWQTIEAINATSFKQRKAIEVKL